MINKMLPNFNRFISANNFKVLLIIFIVLFSASIKDSYSQPRAERFFSRIAAAKGPPLVVDSKQKVNLIKWVYDNIDDDNIEVNQVNLPFLAITAMRNMYLKASSSAYDQGVDVLNFVTQNPSGAIWGHCGTSTDFLRFFLNLFGIASRTVSMFSTLNDGHVALEFFSLLHNKYVFYDPLYGVFLLESSGAPANIDDIQEQIATHGFNYQNWTIDTLKIYGLFSNTPRTAISSTYAEYDALNYSWGILRSYFNFVAIRTEDTTFMNVPLDESNPLLFGKWTVYDNSEIAQMSEANASMFKQQIVQAFDLLFNGRYRLQFLKGIRK
jgi:hypothetical protein